MHGPYNFGFGTNAKPLFLSKRGGFPLVCNQAVYCVYENSTIERFVFLLKYFRVLTFCCDTDCLSS